ncbi:hypothetical protein CEXT_753261 [Caerostris extrusa]|uniref:Uncharacterized protein n=1 Tax=Caerostris extrusa TaxID=172846 RepID=A0AAV4U8U4_CAEEX|nr:hypothetical protein CEXT_753261 [Caerostris extrusa]
MIHIICRRFQNQSPGNIGSNAQPPCIRRTIKRTNKTTGKKLILQKRALSWTLICRNRAINVHGEHDSQFCFSIDGLFLQENWPNNLNNRFLIF